LAKKQHNPLPFNLPQYGNFMSGKEELILDAAERTFAMHGFKETTIREIAGVANVSSAMLGYYFQSKEKLLEAVLERRIDRFAKGHCALLKKSMSATENLLTFISCHIKIIAANVEFFRFILREHLIPSSPESAAIIGDYLFQRLQVIKTILADGVEKGEFKPMDVDLTGLAISGVYVHSLLNSGFVLNQLSAAGLQKRLTSFFEGYIRALSYHNST
jgi:AcrR family transcriptional regulator